jgi:serine protease Do
LINSNSHSFIFRHRRTLFHVTVVMLVLYSIPLPRALGSLRRSPVVVAVEKVGPAVVNISTVKVESRRPLLPLFNDDFFKDFFPGFGRREFRRTSLGSGVIIDGEKGYIITNHHVITRATEIKVITSMKEEYQARLIGSDARSDLAVLQIDTEKKLPEIEMGDSDDLMIGETVIAIGNPFGLSHTVTTGVVSALDRSVRAGDHIYRQFIQTDASINPGNSGGPLLNIEGKLIGINTAIYQKAQGIGFAIPIKKVKNIVRELIREGVVHFPWLGLEIQELTPELRAYFGLHKEGSGVLVSDVAENGPAKQAGVRRGDIIQVIGEYPIPSQSEYYEVLSEFVPNDSLDIQILRKGKEMIFTVRAKVFPLDQALQMVEQRMGIRVGEAAQEILEKYGLDSGVSIQGVIKGSEAERTGLEPGDLILKINELPTKTLDEFKKAIRRYHYLPSITMVVARGPFSYTLTFPF